MNWFQEVVGRSFRAAGACGRKSIRPFHTRRGANSANPPRGSVRSGEDPQSKAVAQVVGTYLQFLAAVVVQNTREK